MKNKRVNNRQYYNLKMTPNRRLESIQEWSDFMKTSSTWNFRSIVGKIMLGLVLAAMIGSIDVAPALGKDGHKRMGKHDKGHYEYVQGRRVYRPYGYGERYYPPPPPVIYAPPPPPGISIFFPPIFIPIR
ncbi:MAG: hypothetical protein COX51_07765 [Syntrophobacteraceae bacterium CG23_combo_of_CG06-09_8_20_14_all_50_8]|nr:MAG: hypothetical protein COX51_07765 [Syntrophobacteraceae bacterium CG23_combo_of_CG06-09_8_20_14_all_50_8]